MTRFRHYTATALTLLLLCAASLPAQPAAKQPQRNPSERELHAIFAADWEYRMQADPVRASLLGDRRYNDRWGDASPAGAAANQRHREQMLVRLQKVQRPQLSPAEQLNYDLFRDELESDSERYRHGLHLIALNQRGGVQTANELADSLRFQTVRDYEDWLARLRALPALLQQTEATLREGMQRRLVLPRVILERIPPQVERQVVSDPAESGFYKPFRQMPEAIPAPEQGKLQQAARQAISEQLVPAYRRFHQFIVNEYLPAGYEQVGVWQAPQGAEIYGFLVRRFTTTNTTAEEVHQVGLREVARIRAQMEQIRQQVGFSGPLGQFFEHLRTDARYYYKTGEELLEGYRAISKQIDPHVVKVFRTMPRMPYGVEPIPTAIAPDTTTAYYRQPAADGSRAGTYFVNLYQPESRPKWEMMALSLHEAVPGHHFQIALAQELGEIPNFRRFGGYTAFVEGWGLYAESLGDDMGLYDDPYSKFGQLTYEMWRAVRLVVDTGMHAKRWTRQQAIEYFRENAPKAELDIVNEIDRYIAWPGQALAYKTGELKIKELRARASRELGERFDVRDFHDVVLLSGAVPLNILERNVDAWIAQARQRGAQADAGQRK